MKVHNQPKTTSICQNLTCANVGTFTKGLLNRIGSILSNLSWGNPYETPGYHKRCGTEYFVIHIPSSKTCVSGFLIEKAPSGAYAVYDLIEGRDGLMGLPQNHHPELRSRYVTQELSSYFTHPKE
jgi:hypothetical protein